MKGKVRINIYDGKTYTKTFNVDIPSMPQHLYSREQRVKLFTVSSEVIGELLRQHNVTYDPPTTYAAYVEFDGTDYTIEITGKFSTVNDTEEV